MPSDASQKKDGDAFDVVLLHGATVDGQGARVVRARPGQLETGEVRPLREGQPLTPGGEVVRLVERAGTPCLYDVKVDYEVPGTRAPSERSASGPAQVATRAYRDSWERTFAPAPRSNDRPKCFCSRGAGGSPGAARPGGAARSASHVRGVPGARAPQPGGTARSASHVRGEPGARAPQPGGTARSASHVRGEPGGSPRAPHPEGTARSCEPAAPPRGQTPMKRRCAKLRSRRARSTLSAASSMSYSIRLNSKRFLSVS